MVTKPKERPDDVRISTHTKLDDLIEATLLSFYGWLGLTDVYWRRVRPAFDPGPGLLVLATPGEWPPEKHEVDTVRLSLYAQPYDRKTAQLGPIAVGQQHKIDLGLMAGAVKAALDQLLELGMEQLRFEIPNEPPYFRRLLTDSGLVPDPGCTDPDRCPMTGPIKGIQERLGIDGTPPEELTQPGFGEDPSYDRLACLVSGLQLGGARQPPGSVINPGIFQAPDGGPPDGGPPEPGVPPGPAPGPDAGAILRGGDLGGRPRR